MHPRDLVLRFLETTGRPAEAEFYLRLFRKGRPESFAVIAVSESAMRLSADALALDLRYLARLGLCPVLVFGLVTPARAREHAEAIRARLADDVFAAITPPDEAAAAAAAGSIPLVPLGSIGGEGKADIDRRFSALADLATALQSRKIVFLGRRSGLKRQSGQIVSLVDLTREAAALCAPGALPPKQAALLSQIQEIEAQIPHRLTLAVTSPLELLRELFTERGAGTLIRRGSNIARFDSLAAADEAKFQALLEAAFGRRPHPRLFSRPVSQVLVADDYRGAVVVTPTPLAPYLSKFAVDPGARGEGVGRDLWRALTEEVPAFFWRSRRENPFTSWYMRHCDGMARAGAWCVFWRGLPEEKLLGAIAYARDADDDFAPAAKEPHMPG